MNIFKNISIGKKLTITLLLVSVLPLCIVVCGFYRMTRHKLQEQTIRTLEVQAKNAAAGLDYYIDFKFRHIYRLASTPELLHILESYTHARQQKVAPKPAAALQARLRIDPDFISLILINSAGDVVLNTDFLLRHSATFNNAVARRALLLQEQFEIPDENYAMRPFFREALKGKKYVSTPCMEKGVPCVYFSIPVVEADKITGVAAFKCHAEELWELIERESGRAGSGNVVILSDADGVRLAHSTNRELIFKSWTPLNPDVKEEVLREKRYGTDIGEITSTDIPEVMNAVTAKTPPRYFRHRLVIEKGTYHSVVRVMDNGWRILCTMPESTFLEPIRDSVLYMGVIGGIITCIVTAASFVIGRLGTKQIQLFASISKEIANGNFTKEVPYTTGDEIGQLAKTFNVMTASVRSRIEQLRYLNDVALEIHSHIDIEALLQNVINVSRKLINAETGVLILLDTQKKATKYFKISPQYTKEYCQVTEYPAVTGILKTLIERNMPIRIDDSGDPGLTGLPLPINHPQVKTLLGVPVEINSVTTGGLFLINKADNKKFAREDEEIILTVSYQAAVAIENARLYGEIHRLAITDGLTGLLNHREFHRRLDETIEGSKRYQYEVVLFMIDIDHFKRFNDTYGHQTGDFVLSTVARLIKSHTRAVDICARYGGEEFAVVIREEDVHQAAVLAERIRSCIYAYPFKHNNINSQLSVSIGIATFPKDADSSEYLIKRADEALYVAKETGRNKVCRYDSLRKQ